MAAAVLTAHARALADVVTLKELVAGGYTYSNTDDVRIEWSSSSKPYNFGGATTLQVGSASSTSQWRVGLVRFDLSALGDVSSVESATLRLYATSTPTTASSTRVQKLTENWTAGTGPTGDYGETLTGATAYIRNLGTMVTPGELTSFTHGGQTLYYVDLPADPALDPISGTTRHYIARAYTGGIVRNYEVGNTAGNTSTTSSGLLSQAADLDTLASKTLNTPWYYYDSAANRLYTRFNNRNFMWFADADLWADAVWDGTSTTAPRNGSVGTTVVSSSVHPSGGGWFEYDITEFVTNWLVDDEANLGVRVHSVGSSANYIFASSDQSLKYDPVNKVFAGDAAYVEANGIYVQPELIISYTPSIVPEPATVALLACGGLALGIGALRRRRSA